MSKRTSKRTSKRDTKNKIKNKSQENECKSTKKCYCFKRDPEPIKIGFKRGFENSYYYKNRKILPNKLNDDKAVVLKAIEADTTYFYSISNRLKNDKDVVLKKLYSLESYERYQEEYFFNFISDKLKDDKDFAMKAIKYPSSFNFISGRLQQDEDIIRNTNFHKLKELRFNKTIDDKKKLLKIIKILKHTYKTFGTSLLLNVSEKLRNDKEVVLKAIELTKNSYEHVSEKLKKDPDVIEALIKHPNFGNFALTKYFPDYNKDIALLIMKYHQDMYQHLKPEFIKDKDVILEALKNNIYIRLYVVPFIPDHMKEDEDIKKILDSKTIGYFSKKYNNDKKFILKSVKRYNTFKWASKELQNDKKVVLTALSNIHRLEGEPDTILTQISDKLKNDKQIFLKAIDNRIKYNKKQQLKSKLNLKSKK